jgi:hypothetical protein
VYYWMAECLGCDAIPRRTAIAVEA